MQGLEVLDALLARHQLRRERFGGVGVLGGLGGVPGGGGLVGQRQGLADVGLQLLDIGELTVQAHLQLPLVADDLGSLLGECLVLTLRLFDGLLDLDLRVGVLVDLGVEQRREVFPRLDERIGHGNVSAFVSVEIALLLGANLSVNQGVRPPPSTQSEPQPEE